MIVAEAETIALRTIMILVIAISMLDSMADSAADSIKTANTGMTNSSTAARAQQSAKD